MLNTMVNLRRMVLSSVTIAVLMSVALANVTAAPPPPPRHFSPAAGFRVPAYGDAGPLCGVGGFGEPAADAVRYHLYYPSRRRNTLAFALFVAALRHFDCAEPAPRPKTG